MQRILAIDAFRGACIVGMVLMHVENIASQIVGNMFAGATVAEWFVFISGLVVVLSLSRKPRETHWAITRKRALRIYLYHLATVLCVIGLFHGLYSFGPYWEWQMPNTALMWSEPFKASVLATIFLYQPYLLDILPMFVVFSLLLPIIYRYANRLHIGFLLCSFGLWTLAQWGLYTDRQLTEPPVEPGYFNLLAWQLLFVLGAYAGVYFLKNQHPFPRKSGITIVAALLFFGLLGLRFIYRIDAIEVHMTLRNMLDFDYFTHSDKTYLGWLRIMNLAVLAYLIPWVILTFRSLATNGMVMLIVRWLAFIGRYSLQVFAFHIPIIYCYQWARFYITGFIMDETLFFLFDMLVTLGIIVSLTIPALMSSYLANKRKSNR